MKEVRSGDEGTIFRTTIVDNGTAVDVSTASTKEIKFLDPKGVKVVKTAAFTTDGSDGKIEYITLTNDIVQVGVWSIEGYVETSAGKWTSGPDQFNCRKVL